MSIGTRTGQLCPRCKKSKLEKYKGCHNKKCKGLHLVCKTCYWSNF